MTVYIDNARLHFRRMVMCHMAASDLTELHAMAEKIGLRREWFQEGSIPHYDVSLGKRALALRCGAVEVNTRTLIKRIKEGL